MQTMTKMPEHIEDMISVRATAELIMEITVRHADMIDFLNVLRGANVTYKGSAKDVAYVQQLEEALEILHEMFADLEADSTATVCAEWNNAMAKVDVTVQNAAKDDMLSCTARILATLMN